MRHFHHFLTINFTNPYVFFVGKRGGDLPKPEVAAAKVEETLVELTESATANLIDHLS